MKKIYKPDTHSKKVLIILGIILIVAIFGLFTNQKLPQKTRVGKAFSTVDCSDVEKSHDVYGLSKCGVWDLYIEGIFKKKLEDRPSDWKEDENLCTFCGETWAEKCKEHVKNSEEAYKEAEAYCIDECRKFEACPKGRLLTKQDEIKFDDGKTPGECRASRDYKRVIDENGNVVIVIEELALTTCYGEHECICELDLAAMSTYNIDSASVEQDQGVTLSGD